MNGDRLIYSLSQGFPPVNEDDCFFVDANILCFFHSGQIYKPSDKTKINIYSNFISHLMSNGNKLSITSLNLQEVLYVIEKTEWENYITKISQKISPKKYRAIQSERLNVKKKMSTAFNQIKENYDIVDDAVTSQKIEDFILNLDTHYYDPIDHIAFNSRFANGFNCITNDSDFKKDKIFSSNSQINLYTY